MASQNLPLSASKRSSRHRKSRSQASRSQATKRDQQSSTPSSVIVVVAVALLRCNKTKLPIRKNSQSQIANEKATHTLFMRSQMSIHNVTCILFGSFPVHFITERTTDSVLVRRLIETRHRVLKTPIAQHKNEKPKHS